MKNLKLFVGGYYDTRMITDKNGEKLEGITPFSTDIETYTLDEALKLAFVENVKTWFEEIKEKDFDEATEEEKTKAIVEYTESDEIAQLLHFTTEEDAEQYKKDVLEELEELENSLVYTGKEQDQYGNFMNSYKKFDLDFKIGDEMTLLQLDHYVEASSDVIDNERIYDFNLAIENESWAFLINNDYNENLNVVFDIVKKDEDDILNTIIRIKDMEIV